MFSGGFCGNRVFGDGFLVVRSWWNVWLRWFFSNHFFGAEKCAIFSGFILGFSILGGELAGVICFDIDGGGDSLLRILETRLTPKTQPYAAAAPSTSRWRRKNAFMDYTTVFDLVEKIRIIRG
ncbi:hypothetical protein [Granulicella sp. S190]|uniref:hypothetical protein n=1 Tax=Granulicella sp. S190 TaxID=1747226 RepID=UPI00131D6EE2|nr:hypothetical protein [Granulicella sp. S190]